MEAALSPVHIQINMFEYLAARELFLLLGRAVCILASPLASCSQLTHPLFQQRKYATPTHAISVRLLLASFSDRYSRSPVRWKSGKIVCEKLTSMMVGSGEERALELDSKTIGLVCVCVCVFEAPYFHIFQFRPKRESFLLPSVASARPLH